MVSWSHEEWVQARDMFYSAAERLADVGDPASGPSSQPRKCAPSCSSLSVTRKPVWAML